MLAGALLQIDNLDREVSDQLVSEKPLFGNTADAREASDNLRDLNQAAYVATAILVPGPEDNAEWLGTKFKLIGSEWLVVDIGQEFTSGAKKTIGRERPNRQDNMSFPSRHTFSATVQAQMAKLNTEFLPISHASRRALDLTFDGISVLTAWARMEAGEHYPSDVLAGWSIGYFFGHLARDFIFPDEQRVHIQPQFASGNYQLGLMFRF